ncbi:MAG TPA: type I methionyl aminopeptidase [bacterium]|nr:type I methionyl aminopeptidase [bacterium]HPS29486.1 type I methionyl aminopeptidase [bacterium]
MSGIIIKTPEQIEKIHAAGKILAELYADLKTYIRPGVSTLQIDSYADRFIKKRGGFPTFKSVAGYRNATCIAINNEVVHGIPRKSKIIKKGDIIKVDCGVTLNGYIGDSTETYLMSGADDIAKKLVDVTRKCLEIGIKECVPGKRIGDIGAAIQEYAESNGFSVVTEYVGHGTGVHLHEDPPVPHYGTHGEGELLTEGMVLAIEPMINEGTYKCRTLNDGWTVVTLDGKLSCQVEHTVAITANGPKILTLF